MSGRITRVTAVLGANAVCLLKAYEKLGTELAVPERAALAIAAVSFAVGTGLAFGALTSYSDEKPSAVGLPRQNQRASTAEAAALLCLVVPILWWLMWTVPDAITAWVGLSTL